MSAGLEVHGLGAQAAAVAGGEISPGRLFEAAREVCDALDAYTNAVSAVFDGDLERELAAAGDGPLRGVTVGIKDMFDCSWRRPHDGTPVPVAAPAAGPAGAVRRLQEAGALPLVAANLHELGVGTTGHISAKGPIRNPLALDRCAGGSSGGSAAVVAAGALPAAVGTDAAGSIRIPAAYCGIVGLKPTWGAVPVDGYTGGYSTMGVIGPMARDAADCRLLGEALLGRPLAAPEPAPLRIGVPRRSHWSDVDGAVLAACEEALDALRADGAEVREVELADTEHLVLAAIVATGTERLPQLDADWVETVLPRLHPSTRGLIKSRFELSANLVQRVARYRALVRRGLARTFETVDVLAMPTVPTTAPPVERPRVQLPSGPASADASALHYAALANLTGVPAISVPCGRDAEGLPIGICLHARWGEEAALLALAERLERSTERAFVLSGPAAAPNHPEVSR